MNYYLNFSVQINDFFSMIKIASGVHLVTDSLLDEFWFILIIEQVNNLSILCYSCLQLIKMNI